MMKKLCMQNQKNIISLEPDFDCDNTIDIEENREPTIQSSCSDGDAIENYKTIEHKLDQASHNAKTIMGHGRDTRKGHEHMLDNSNPEWKSMETRYNIKKV